MSRLSAQMESLTPPTDRDRLRAYSQRLAAHPDHDPNEHARRAIDGELWRRSLAKRPIPRHRALIPYAAPNSLPRRGGTRQSGASPGSD